MSEPIPPPTKVKSTSCLWAWLRAAGFGIQLTLALALVLYAVHFYRISIQFQAALDDMDKNHPGWRFKDIEAARAVVPDDENSALRVTEMVKLLPDQWIDDKLEGEVDSLRPESQMTPEQFEGVQQSLKKVLPALEIMRTLADLPKGRFPIVYGADRSNDSSPLMPLRNAIRLPCLDADVRLQAGDVRGAVDSCRSAHSMARSIDDDPTIISQIVRVALVAVASNTVKRILADPNPMKRSSSPYKDVLRLRKDIPIGRLRGGDNAPCKPFLLEAMAKGRTHSAGRT